MIEGFVDVDPRGVKLLCCMNPRCYAYEQIEEVVDKCPKCGHKVVERSVTCADINHNEGGYCGNPTCWKSKNAHYHERLHEDIVWETTDGRPYSDADGTHPNDDDFICRWRGLTGRVEQMNKNSWYFGVYNRKNGHQVHHWMDDNITPSTKEAAIFICESLMRLHVMKNGM